MTQIPQENISAFELAVLAANLAESKKATDTLVLDTGKVSYLADYFVVCTGDSPAQIRTIADAIDKVFRQRGQMRIGTELDKSYKWCLLDYGDVVIHVMHRNEREFYQLEHFWSHANTVAPDKWLNIKLQEAS
ncbi:ribosome silencing factor [Vampirovibrio sp.]|uniref:ribosome silencing factor n=1 Tax=Vampirovibrio sp. TaxID=2717857 RepID=UPI0035945219